LGIYPLSLHDALPISMERAVGIDLLRQRELHENPVDLGIGVEPLEQTHETSLGGVLGKLDGFVVKPRLVAGLSFHTDVDLGRGIDRKSTRLNSSHVSI